MHVQNNIHCNKLHCISIARYFYTSNLEILCNTYIIFRNVGDVQDLDKNEGDAHAWMDRNEGDAQACRLSGEDYIDR